MMNGNTHTTKSSCQKKTVPILINSSTLRYYQKKFKGTFGLNQALLDRILNCPLHLGDGDKNFKFEQIGGDETR